MKIKEVITATGLTDRAVRLYIEEGLLVPDIKESYSGRRSIEFSTDDVEKLKCISLLRCAGFSIAHIKALGMGGRPAGDALRDFLSEKQRQHELDGKVIESLSAIDADGEVTLENVASRLTDEMLEGVENDDLKPADGKTWVNVVCLIISLVAGGIALYEIWTSATVFWEKHRFPVIGTMEVSYAVKYVPPIVVLVLIGVLMFFRFRKQKKASGRVLRIVVTAVLVITLLIHIVLSPFYMILVCLGAIFDSRTVDPDDYFVFDNWVNRSLRSEIAEIFPSSIPMTAMNNSLLHGNEDYADTTEYLYYMEDDLLFTTLNIYAQWCVSPVDCENERVRIEETFPEAEWVENGDFVCAYIPINKESKAMFAYNVDGCVVRYGFYWSDSGADTGTPYYETVEWRKSGVFDFDMGQLSESCK